MFESYLCPDVACPCDKKLKEGENCPECKTAAKNLEYRTGVGILI